MRWNCVRGRDPGSKMEYFVLLQDNRGGYTAYEMQSAMDKGTVEDVIKYGVPIYYTHENALIKGSYTWLVNYAAEKCGETTKVTPEWRDMNSAFETCILGSEPMDSIEDGKFKRPGPPPEVPPKKAKTISADVEMKS